MTRVKSWLSAGSIVTVPKIHHLDTFNNVIIMEDCGTQNVTLKEFLRSGQGSAPGLAESIGTSLGEFIASMHQWGKKNPDGILDVFATSTYAKEISVFTTYGRLMDTLELKGDNIPPKLMDPPIEVDKADLEVVSKIVDELTSDMMAARDVVSYPQIVLLTLGLMNDCSHLISSSWVTFGPEI
jgi:hypothetical protein